MAAVIDGVRKQYEMNDGGRLYTWSYVFCGRQPLKEHGGRL